MTFAVQQACSRQQRRSLPQRNFAGGVFQSECAHLRRRWSEKHDTGVLARLGKVGVLTEKSVARMNRFSAGLFCSRENGALIQIAFRRGRRAEQHRRIRLRNMKRVTIRFGKYGDREKRQAAAECG